MTEAAAALATAVDVAGVFPGDSEMAALMRATDWSRTDIGAVETWPQSLRTALSICLESRFPILIWWGPHLVKLYNDAYRMVVGDKHPRALGQRGAETWAEIWDVIGPLLDSVMRDGRATWSEDQLLLMDRRGFTEETYFTFSYSPIRDETGGVGGVFTAVTETTERVIRERRLARLRELAIDEREPREAARAALGVLARAAADVPFAVFLPATGTPIATPNARWHDDAGDPIRAGTLFDLADVASLDVHRAEGAPRPERAMALVVDRAGHDEPFGRLILGLSPRLADDDEYRDFLRLVTASVATALSNAEAFDEQRRRAEALAEIDRAKTAFFTNISHEFRTPLTLLLGPLERLAASPTTSAADRAEAEVAARNANRLLRLVNTLLEFSRLEAGRTTARYEPTDLAELTADLASTFRSAFDRAGVALRLDLAPLSRAAYVDRDMWERIVLNLLSNAFKYTLQGEVAVTLREEAGEAALAVSDTGSGIPPDELPRLFERFHRIEGIPSRSHEGTGIGLALAAELAALHAGRIDVESEPGRGSVFTVRLPLGREHLPPERIVVRGAETATGGLPQRRAFADEALSWIADQPSDTPAREAASDGSDARPGRVLVVDDNADMREYVRRVLSDFDVDTAANTAEAIARLEASPPDIVVSDVMMPGDDGLALLDAIRRDPDRRTIPVILVSARVGPEAQREALEVGADDYLVKPFAAADLRARVGAHLAAARLRSQAVEDLRGALAAKDDFLGMVSHELRTPLTTILGHARLLDTPGRATTPDLLRDEIDDIRAEAERLNRIVENLLVVARLDAGRVAESEPLLADRLIIGAVARTRREHPDHEFRHAAAAEPAFVEANAGYLEQVLTNLLGNAAKYSPPGTTIETSSHIVDGEFVVRVEDRGLGIEPAELGAIFDPFYRSERTSGQAGLGLGLAVCRRLVESMGGWLRASPREGGGATFSFGLPLANADEA